MLVRSAEADAEEKEAEELAGPEHAPLLLTGRLAFQGFRMKAIKELAQNKVVDGCQHAGEGKTLTTKNFPHPHFSYRCHSRVLQAA